MLLGGVKVLLGLLFGSSLFALLQAFPQPLLGALLAFSGIELASSAAKEPSGRGWALMLLTAAAILGLGSASLGFAVGYCGLLALLLWEGAAALLARATKGRLGGAAGARDHDEEQSLMARQSDGSGAS